MSPGSDDDETLLVLADELQLKGDPRGELIGVQVELERGGFDRARGVALRKREGELIARHGEVCYWVERILASRRVTNFEAIDPIVRWSRLGPYVDHEAYVTEAVVEWLVTSNALASLTGLQLPSVNVATYQRLRKYGGLSDLRLQLDLRYSDACDDPGELRPKRLALTGTSFGKRHPQAVISMLRTAIVDEVVDLEVSTLVPQDELVARSCAKRLKTLRGGIHDFAAKLPLLANEPDLSGLEELVLHGGGPDTPLDALHAPAHLESLRVLRLACELTADTVLRFLDSPLGRRLELLDLRPAKPELAEALRGCGWDGCLHV